MAAKEEILEKVNQLCEEHEFDFSETFRDKFADKFAEKFAEAAIDDEVLGTALELSVIESGHARKSAFSEVNKQWAAKEAEYKSQLEKLAKSEGNKPGGTKEEEKPKFELPEEFKAKMEAFDNWQKEQKENSHRTAIFNEAKKNVQEHLHGSLEKYLKKQNVSLDSTAKEEAKRIVEDFNEVFKDAIGDTRPLASGGRTVNDDDFIKSLPKIKIKS